MKLKITLAAGCLLLFLIGLIVFNLNDSPDQTTKTDQVTGSQVNADWEERTNKETELTKEFQSKLKEFGYDSPVLTAQYENRTNFTIKVPKTVTQNQNKKQEIEEIFSSLAKKHQIENYKLILEPIS